MRSHGISWAHQVTPAMSWRARMASITLAAASVFTTSAYPTPASWQPSRLFPHPGWSTRTLPGGQCLQQEHSCIGLWLHVTAAMGPRKATRRHLFRVVPVLKDKNTMLCLAVHMAGKCSKHNRLMSCLAPEQRWFEDCKLAVPVLLFLDAEAVLPMPSA